MGNFTFEETNLLCIYNTGSRTGLMEALTTMCGELASEETELRELTDSALTKLQDRRRVCRAGTVPGFRRVTDFPKFKIHLFPKGRRCGIIKTNWNLWRYIYENV